MSISILLTGSGCFDSHYDTMRSRAQATVHETCRKDGVGKALADIKDLHDIRFGIEPITKQEIMECLNSGQEIKPRMQIITETANGNYTADTDYEGKVSLLSVLLSVCGSPNDLQLLTPLERASHEISAIDHWSDPVRNLSLTKEFKTVLCFTRATPLPILREAALVRGEGTDEGGLCFCKHKALNQPYPPVNPVLETRQACQECMIHSIEDIFNTATAKGMTGCVRET